ncbi:MAG: hypothetical protein WBF17_19400 [Phycisphaerae bacterium]
MFRRTCLPGVAAASLALTAACCQAAAGAGGGDFAALLDLKQSVQDGCWSAGTWENALALKFDMGTKRVNWNHARHAICTFSPARDISAYKGLRIRVATDRPRGDVEVSVWLGEEDGSWYYLKSAVPLVAKANEAVVLFEDFNVAEWIVPGSHQDEDFIIDLKSIGKVAVGVVNPFGVGEVAFRLTGLDLVKPGPHDAPRIAAARVTGKTVSVNGHEVVPAGIFGGYANYIPQEYRPGCQRNLYAPDYPIVPRQRFVCFNEQSFTDWPAMVRALRGESEPHRKLCGHLLGLIDDERLLGGLRRLDIDRRIADARKRARDPNAAPRELTAPLDFLLRRPEMYSSDAWAAVPLDEDLKAPLGRLAKGELNDTELMELNRRLLEAAFGKLIRPVSRHGPTEMFYVNCFGERKNTAHLLYRSDWKEMFTEYGRRLALNARKAGYQAHWEFWNEPYLHWNRDRIGLRTRYFREDLAREGGPVTVKRTSEICDSHVLDWPGFIAALKAQAAAEGHSPGKRILALLGSRTAGRIEGLATGQPVPPDVRREVLGRMNKLLADRKLYDAESWKSVKLGKVARESLAVLKAAEPDRRKLGILNRALIADAFGGKLAPDPALRDGEVIPHYKWVRGSDPKGLAEAVNGLYVVDETAFTFWSGAGNGWIYDQMLAAVASSIKRHNPLVQVIAGWGFRWNEDHWDAWRIVYKNTIDRNIEWIDGVHEHHYQGDTTAMNGSYEVLAAYGVTRHNKWLYSYNTETNDLLDTPARGAAKTPEKAAASREYRQMVYNLRDLIYSAIQSPDKYRARTMIHPHKVPDATRVCFGLLRDLRGRLVEASCDDDNVWAVASIDGTDPRAMPPDFDGAARLVVVVYNDYRRPQEVDVAVDAPRGTTFGDAAIERTTVDRSTFAVDLLRRRDVKVGRTTATFRIRLDDRSAWKVTLPLEGRLAPQADLRRKQFFSGDILEKVRPHRPWRTTVALDPGMLRAAGRAWLRLVIEDVAVGEGTVTVAGRTMPLPKACTADNVNRIVEVPLEVKALRPETEVAFAVCPGNFAGYQVDMTSIVLETRRE